MHDHQVVASEQFLMHSRRIMNGIHLSFERHTSWHQMSNTGSPITAQNPYVSLQLRVQNAVSAQPCVGKLGISLVLLNFFHCNFRLWFETTWGFNSYPCHASEMTKNTLNHHCLKFTLHSISCHICYRKISEKNFNTLIKVKLLVSKTSDSCFQGFDFFQMLLACYKY